MLNWDPGNSATFAGDTPYPDDYKALFLDASPAPTKFAAMVTGASVINVWVCTTLGSVLLLARGVPPPAIILTLLFVFMILMPYFVLGAVALGLSDVWLDYRQLEPAVHEDQNEGDR